jgi:hypothetical protein
VEIAPEFAAFAVAMGVLLSTLKTGLKRLSLFAR